MKEDTKIMGKTPRRLSIPRRRLQKQRMVEEITEQCYQKALTGGRRNMIKWLGKGEPQLETPGKDFKMVKKKPNITEKIKNLKKIFEKQPEEVTEKKKDGRKRKNQDWEEVVKRNEKSSSECGLVKPKLPTKLRKIDGRTELDPKNKGEGSVGETEGEEIAEETQRKIVGREMNGIFKKEDF